MRSKKPRFFCDNCGHEVGHELKACPRCGRFFASVRCPSCEFTGEEKMFLNGCPMCGYSASPETSRPSKSRRKKARLEHNSSGVSFWTFFFAFIVLIVMVLLLAWLITR